MTSAVGKDEKLPRGRLHDLQKRFSQVVNYSEGSFQFGCDYTAKKNPSIKAVSASKNSDSGRTQATTGLRITASNQSCTSSKDQQHGTSCMQSQLPGNQRNRGQRVGECNPHVSVDTEASLNGTHRKDEGVCNALGDVSDSTGSSPYEVKSLSRRKPTGSSHTGNLYSDSDDATGVGVSPCDSGLDSASAQSTQDSVEGLHELPPTSDLSEDTAETARRRTLRGRLGVSKDKAFSLADQVSMERSSRPPKDSVARKTCFFESSSSEISDMLDLVDKHKLGGKPWRDHTKGPLPALPNNTSQSSPISSPGHSGVGRLHKGALADLQKKFALPEAGFRVQKLEISPPKTPDAGTKPGSQPKAADRLQCKATPLSNSQGGPLALSTTSFVPLSPRPTPKNSNATRSSPPPPVPSLSSKPYSSSNRPPSPALLTARPATRGSPRTPSIDDGVSSGDEKRAVREKKLLFERGEVSSESSMLLKPMGLSFVPSTNSPSKFGSQANSAHSASPLKSTGLAWNANRKKPEIGGRIQMTTEAQSTSTDSDTEVGDSRSNIGLQGREHQSGSDEGSDLGMPRFGKKNSPLAIKRTPVQLDSRHESTLNASIGIGNDSTSAKPFRVVAYGKTPADAAPSVAAATKRFEGQIVPVRPTKVSVAPTPAVRPNGYDAQHNGMWKGSESDESGLQCPPSRSSPPTRLKLVNNDNFDIPLGRGVRPKMFTDQHSATEEDEGSYSDVDSSLFDGYSELRLATSGQLVPESRASTAPLIRRALPRVPRPDSSSEDEEEDNSVFSPPPPRKLPPRVLASVGPKPPAKPPRTFAHNKYLQKGFPALPRMPLAPAGTHTYEDVADFSGGEYASLRYAMSGVLPEDRVASSPPPPLLPARNALPPRLHHASYSAINLTSLPDDDMSWRVPPEARHLSSITSSDEEEAQVESSLFSNNERRGSAEKAKSALGKLRQFLRPRRKPAVSNLKKYASAECISQVGRVADYGDVSDENESNDDFYGGRLGQGRVNGGASKTATMASTGKFIKNKKNKPDKGTFGISKLAFKKPAPGNSQAKSFADQAKNTAIVVEREKIFSKLHTVFSVLQAFQSLNSPTEESSVIEEETPNALTLEKRLKHCASVKNYSSYSTLEKLRSSSNRAQLYQYALAVSIRKNPNTNVYEPYVKFKFPHKVEPEKTAIPMFCFPDADSWHRVQEYKSESYSFVLTDVSGSRQYGYCRRILSKSHKDIPSTPDVYCIVSPLNAFKFFDQVLDEVEKRAGIPDNAEEFLKAAYGRPLPNPGNRVTVKSMSENGEMGSVDLSRSPENQREGLSYSCLLQFLSVGKVIKIFSAILLERNVIFCADKLSHLSQCVHAFASLLYPFSWEHTFIPLLPASLLDIVCAPTPFIVGVISSHKDELADLEREPSLIINLDTNKFLEREGDEEEILPKKIVRALTSALSMAKNDDTMCSETIMETFVRFFVEVMGNCNKFIVKEENGNKVFQKEEFIAAADTPAVGAFLEWFTATQMFSVYVNERLEESVPINGVFERRVEMWNQEKINPKLKKGKKWKKWQF